MNKYVVKNCPAFNEDYNECCGKSAKFIYCMDNTDCLIKQVIEKCKNDCVYFGDKELRYDTLEEILQLFEIEEV